MLTQSGEHSLPAFFTSVPDVGIDGGDAQREQAADQLAVKLTEAG